MIEILRVTLDGLQPIGQARLVGNRVVAEGAADGLYDWSKVTTDEAFVEAYNELLQHAAGRYIHIELRR